MRAVLAFLVVLSVLTLSSRTIAQQADQDRDTSVVNDGNDGIVGEACFGDRYESDDDMNDGNTITDEEIRLILNPPRS
ncbi:MAG: hypothetical protein IH925_01280 [Proteobacteria bacterium]|nr:hypothetical protein [Pseudomonadota bacterium]